MIPFTKKEKQQIRTADKSWFSHNLWNFMENKHIHHEWDNGAFCFVLSKEEHLERTREEIRRKYKYI